MKKIFSFFILYILVNLAAIAQQEPLFSNYMFSRTIANPSFVGAEKTINATFCNRTMFAGIDGKPVTSVFGVEAPVEIFGTKSGFGLVVISDELGFESNVNVNATYAYHHKLQGGTLGGGISVGFNDYSIVFNDEGGGGWNTPYDLDGNQAAEDDHIPDPFSTPTPKVVVDVGIHYETPLYYIGFSASNLNRPNIIETLADGTENFVSYYAVNYILTGAYNIELPDPLFDLQTSFLLQSDLAAYSLDVNGTIFYKSKYWGGIGLRTTPQNISAFTVLGGIELMNGLNLGYALDINTSAMFLGGATSHEVMVTYSFNLDTKRDQKYKSVRYL